MIEGKVNDHYEAVVHLPLLNSSGQTKDIEAVIDTGFTRYLTLPPAMVAELGLGYRGVNSVILADCSETTLEVYGVTVLWDGQPREVVAYVSDTMPLIGMSLLHRQSNSRSFRYQPAAHQVRCLPRAQGAVSAPGRL